MATDGVRFIKDGPAIPIELLQQLDDGQITIFAGAGVSRRCGLPDFAGLVTEACARLGRAMNPDEAELFAHGAFDAALGLIETRIPQGRLRKVVGEILAVPDGADLGTHAALLTLATSKQGCLRLVTTNFDRAFELAPYARKRVCDFAPYLPLPASAWNSVVYLHGGLGDRNDPGGERLLLTSSDFGRAYITQGWASRFLAELFRRSGAILFVGYSVSDPAIRYIVDAFAADRGDKASHVAPAYIFVESGSIQDERTWKSRGVESLTFDPKDNYRLLHETLRRCAERYATGMFDRASIVLEFGSRSPLGTLDREAISQMTWALNEPSGYAARRFAELHPPAPIAWLDVLHGEGLFRLSSDAPICPIVAPVPPSSLTPLLHRTTEALCRWLCGHLGAPNLIEWVIANGCHLHPQMAEVVHRRLADSGAPRLPKGPERLWRFWSASSAPVYDPSVELQALGQDGAIEAAEWSPLLRDAFLASFAPTLLFKRPFRFDGEDIDREAARSYAEIELLPASAPSAQQVFGRLLARADSNVILPELVGDFGQLLYRGLTYLEYFDVISPDSDGSFSVRPSIDDHPQNSGHEIWEVYIYALRLAWERMAASDPLRARAEVSRWMAWPFPIFRRFVLWSAGRPGGLTADEAVHFLVQRPPSTLWGVDTRRELLQYLRTAGRNLSQRAAQQLTDLILTGPPRAQYREEVSPDEFAEIRDRATHLRLAKLEESGCDLPAGARMAWDEI
jgi:SIR2-like domain